MFGFLKDTLKKTIENFSKKVDEETKNVEPTEEQKEELIKEIKKAQEEKGFFQKLKDTFTKEETKELAQEAKQILTEEKKFKEEEKEVQNEEKQIEKEEEELLEEVADLKEKKAEGKEILQQKKEEIQDIEEKIEEGEKELEELEKKEEEVREKEQELTEKKEELQEEKKGFFAKLKEKIFKTEEETLEKEEGKEQELFETTDNELEEFQEAFKETEKGVVEEETEEIIPIVTEEAGETKVELREKHIEKKRNVLEKKEEKITVEGEEKGFFAALKETIFKTSLSEEKFEELFWDIEVVLLENNVAVEVIDLIKTNLKKELVEKKILRGQIDTLIIHALKKAIEETFHVEQLDLLSKVKEKTPFVLVFVGVNGSGKTTTIAKIAHLLQQHSKSCVIAAGDTFRAAAIQQLEEHAKKLKVKLIKHDYGADPAAVGFDAIMYAKAHNIDCVLIDTAGRLHSNVNLMDEMKKIMRVTKPDLKLFIGEAITGNDCVEQARRFHDAVGIDGIILAKADVDEKGGAALSVSYVTKKPILYFGTGQRYQDLEPFDKNKVMERLGLS